MLGRSQAPFSRSIFSPFCSSACEHTLDEPFGQQPLLLLLLLLLQVLRRLLLPDHPPQPGRPVEVDLGQVIRAHQRLLQRTRVQFFLKTTTTKIFQRFCFANLDVSKKLVQKVHTDVGLPVIRTLSEKKEEKNKKLSTLVRICHGRGRCLKETDS